MKKMIVFSVSFAAAIFSYAFHSFQTIEKTKAKPSSSRFTGTWSGAEKCNSVSAPVAILTVTVKGSELRLKGIYSIQGTIRAAPKGDNIIIPKQEVADDPNFSNMYIEGNLALDGTPSSLSGKIYVTNNQIKDSCFVKYSK